MKALLLAARKGTRLKPITNTIPKVMVDINGKPCLQYNLELLKKYGIKDIAINTHYLPEKIIDYFSDGKKFGVNLKYSYEKEILGTAGALNNFKNYFNDELFVIYGDTIHNTNLNEMAKFHKEKKGFATIAVDNRNQIGRGAVVFDDVKRVVKFVEKPKKEITNAKVNTGVYILPPKILEFIPEGFSDFGYDILPKLLEKEKEIYAYDAGEAIDIGTIEQLEKARKLFSLK